MADIASQDHEIPSAPDLDTSESSPLLQEQQRNEPPPAFNQGYQPQDPTSHPNSPPPAYTESPPPYTPNVNFPSGNAEPSVICRVCQQIIYIHGREQQRVVKCSNCQEATPIKPPPSGKKYIRCPCNALLTCKVTSTRISCPRPNCKRIINLTPRPTGGAIATTVPGVRGRFRVTCGHCNEVFVFHSTNHLARCAHCRRVSSVGPKFAKTRGIIFAIVGILLLAAGAGVTVGTFELAKQSSGIYVVWIGAFVAGILNLIRSCYYCTMTVSRIERDRDV